MVEWFTSLYVPSVPAHMHSLAVLFVADLFHPVNGLAVKLFLNGNVRHGSGWRRAVPVLFARRKPNHVAGMNFLGWAAFALHPTATGGDQQGLAQRGCAMRFERPAQR